MSKETKIDFAIRETQNRLNEANKQIELMIRQRDVLTAQIDALESIKKTKHLR